jgi:hypothetical protein
VSSLDVRHHAAKRQQDDEYGRNHVSHGVSSR